MTDVRTARAIGGADGRDELPEDIAKVVETYRETFELVAEGNDESARMARNILEIAEDEDGK